MSDGTAMTAIWVTMALAFCGWLVLIWLENHKTNRDELTRSAQAVGEADMEMRSIIGLGHPATGPELARLRGLINGVERAADQHFGELRVALQKLAGLLRAFVQAEAPALAEVRTAYLSVGYAVDVPAALTLERLTLRGQEQVELYPQIQAAVRCVEDHFRRQSRLRFNWRRWTS